MCDPVTASIALTVAGTASQAAAANQAKKAMQGAQSAERIRQKGYQDESSAVQAGSEKRMSKASQDKGQADAEASRNADYAAANAAAQAPTATEGANLAGDQSANAIIASENARASQNALGYAGQQGNAKAALQGFGDLQLGNALANARAMEQQRQLGNFMQGSSGVLGLEMDEASHKGDSLKSLGQLLSTAGSIAGMGAGAGWWGAKDAAAAAGNPALSNLVKGATVIPSGYSLPSTPIDFSKLTMNNPNSLGLASPFGGTLGSSLSNSYLKAVPKKLF
jgi:hypothetical protein